MQKLVINKLGPISRCELEIKDFTIFTGAQASGKSTVAKSVFFFRNIKNLLNEQLRKKFLLSGIQLDDSIELSTKNVLIRAIRSNFLQIFGTTWHMDKEMSLKYYYSDDIYIQISLKEDWINPNYIWVSLSKELERKLSSFDEGIPIASDTGRADINFLQEMINSIFNDDMEIVYIPAGRSMITLLSSQLNYIYSSMSDLQKRSIDYCTQNYLERILSLKSFFQSGPRELIQNQLSLTTQKVDKELLLYASDMMRTILSGEYKSIDGEERLYISDEKYIKINFASSGQQESVWILNTLFYYLLANKRTFFIIEEPESHLFPNSQKQIMEYISLVQKRENSMFLTTHSPYILGTVNNLLYANKISSDVDQTQLKQIISEKKWMSYKTLSAYFTENGLVLPCVEDEFEAIDNSIIDGASEEINADYEKMVQLKHQDSHIGGV